MAYEIGEEAGPGVYLCTHCSRWQVRLLNEDDTLPPCAKCGDTPFVKFRQIGVV